MKFCISGFILFLTLSTAWAEGTFRFSGTVGTVGSLLGSSVVAGDVFQFDVVFDETITHAGAYSPFYKFFSSTLDIQSTGSGTLT